MLNTDRIGQSRHGWTIRACTRHRLGSRGSVIYDVEHLCGVRQKMSFWMWHGSRLRCARCHPRRAIPITTQLEGTD